MLWSSRYGKDPLKKGKTEQFLEQDSGIQGDDQHYEKDSFAPVSEGINFSTVEDCRGVDWSDVLMKTHQPVTSDNTLALVL